MTRAFAAIAGNVESVESYAVRSIYRGEQVVHTRAAATRPSPADPAARAAMIDLLAGVVREGTGKAARIPGPAAGKTGTTQDYRDAWFIGFTPELVVGVWVGNDDNASMNGVTGGNLPATIWREFVTQAGAGKTLAAASPARRAPSATGPARDPGPGQTAPPRAGTIGGSAMVLDTATLELQGQIVRLIGVEGMNGRFARGLGRFLRRREVICEPASAQAYRCRVGDQDLSELILLNGGAGRPRMRPRSCVPLKSGRARCAPAFGAGGDSAPSSNTHRPHRAALHGRPGLPLVVLCDVSKTALLRCFSMQKDMTGAHGDGHCGRSCAARPVRPRRTLHRRRGQPESFVRSPYA